MGKSIGLVPIRTNVHKGHLALIKAARSGNDVIIASLLSLPPDLKSTVEGIGEIMVKQDEALLAANGVDCLFLPSRKILSGELKDINIQSVKLMQDFEGTYDVRRYSILPTLMASIFNIIQPTRLYLGQRKAQEGMVAQRLIDELHYHIEVSIQPTIRESNGLAMSNANSYLAPAERKDAPLIYQSLQLARSLINAGERDARFIINPMKEVFQRSQQMTLEYIAIVQKYDFEPVQILNEKQSYYVLAACSFSRTRLIDNILIEL